MEDRVTHKKKLRINFSKEETRASKGRRYLFFGFIVIAIAFLMVFSSVGAATALAPSNSPVLSNQSSPLAVYNQAGKEIPFANVGNTAEYTSSNISYVMTNVTAGEMSQNDVGKITTDTGAPNSSSSASVSYSPLSTIRTDNVGTEPQTNISTGGTPKGILYYQANNTIYAANSTGNNVWAINATTGAIIKSIVVGPDPGFMALDPIDKHIFITSVNNDSIYVINATTNKLNATITAPADSNPYGVSNPPATSAPNGIAFNPTTKTLFLVLTNNGVLDVLNATQNKITSTFFDWGNFFDVAPYTVSITPSGVIYVLTYGMYVDCVTHSNREWVFHTSSTYNSTALAGSAISSPTLAGGLYGMAYDPINGLEYIADSGSDTVYAVNSSAHINATITLSVRPYWISYVSAGNSGKGYLYVTATASNQLLLVNATSESVVWNGTATSPGEIVYANSSVANKVYMTDTSGQVVNFGALQEYLAVFMYDCTTGFPSSTPAWTVHVSSPCMHPNETTLSIPANKNGLLYLFNGTYTWTANATYKELPTSGRFVKTGTSPQTVTVVFTAADVSITETGLPSGTKWCFNLTAPSASKQSYSSTTTTIDFLISNGNYSFEIPNVKSGSVVYGVSSITAASGNFTISSDNFIESVQFVVANAITFNESGLLIGSGNYAYSTPKLSCDIFVMPLTCNYNAVEFKIGETHIVNHVSFVLVGTGEIMFAIGSTGIDSTNVLNWVTTNISNPCGQQDTERINPVTLEGGTDYYLSIDVLSGSVGWEEQATSCAIKLGYIANFCDYSTGAHSSTACTYLYAVGETPSAGDSTSWSIGIDGSNLSSTSTSISTDLVPGTYNYSVYTNTYVSNTSHAFLFGGNGSLTVSNRAQTVNLTFSSITLHEKGLPSSKTWEVKFVNGGTVNDTFGTTSLSFPFLYGTYSYYGIAPNKNYTASSGTFTVSNNTSAVITYSLLTYAVTFTEGLLPQGMSWTVTLGTYSNTSTQPVISIMAPNGTYDYTIIANGYTATPASGQITISGKSVNISTVFSLTPPQPSVPAYTITIGFGTSYQNFKPVATFTFTYPENTINILPIDYLTVNPSYHLIFEINQSAPLHYFHFNLSGNTGAFAGIGYNGFSELGYIVGGTGIIIALVFSSPWISIYRADEKWKKAK